MIFKESAQNQEKGGYLAITINGYWILSENRQKHVSHYLVLRRDWALQNVGMNSMATMLLRILANFESHMESTQDRITQKNMWRRLESPYFTVTSMIYKPIQRSLPKEIL